MMSSRRARATTAAIAGLVLASCTSGQVGQFPIAHVDPAANSKLQFGVGWATSYPANPPQLGDPGYGINLVETFRQPNGRSAVLTDSAIVNVPTPFAQQLAPLQAGNNALTLTTTDNVEAFGAGFNSGSFTSTGTSNPDIGVGGPPAFPPPGDATSVTKQFSEGYYATFPIAPQGAGSVTGLPLAAALQTFAGAYALHVTLPTGATSTEVVSTTATLAGSPLPVYAPPAIAPDGSGGALVTIAVPSGVIETIVTVTGTACLPSAAGGVAETYTLVSHKAGPATDRLTLPDFVTPIGGGATYQSLCSAAELGGTNGNFAVYAVGFDYPAFESVYPQSFSEAPAIVGAAGRPDLTISAATAFLTP